MNMKMKMKTTTATTTTTTKDEKTSLIHDDVRILRAPRIVPSARRPRSSSPPARGAAVGSQEWREGGREGGVRQALGKAMGAVPTLVQVRVIFPGDEYKACRKAFDEASGGRAMQELSIE